MLLLEFAYSIVEEGIAVRSFSTRHWKDIGMFGVYGKWLGANWVWSLYLTIFHGVWSVLTPIVIVEAIYFRVAYKQWVREKELVFSALFRKANMTGTYVTRNGMDLIGYYGV